MNRQSSARVHINNLSIGYHTRDGKRVVSSGITADIRAGELTCLLGANGVGKSTLLRTLSAFQPSLSGEICLQGKLLNEYTDKQLARLLSVVLTDRCDIRNLSVFELVGLGRSPYTGFWGVLGEDDRYVVRKSISMVGIEHLSLRMVHTLSDGERQKVMIAKALAQETPLIYLDEPTAFLDFPSKVEIMQLLHRFSRQTGKTIFLSTHDMELALQMADCLWLMDKDRGVKTGVPEDLVLDGSLKSFFTSPDIAFDADTGQFRVLHECRSYIRLCGSGVRYVMARKALMRNGIDASSEIQSDTEVNIMEDGGFTVRRLGRDVAMAGNIADMLELLLK